MKNFCVWITVLSITSVIYSQDPIELEDPVLFADWIASTDGYDICSLSSEKVVIAYYKGGTSAVGFKVGNIQNNSITLENEFVLSPLGPHTILLSPLPNNKFFIVYQNTGGLFVRAGKVINGNEIVLGNEFPIENTPHFHSLTSINDNTAVVAYHDGNQGVCKVIETDESLSLSLTSAYNFTDTSFYNFESISIDKLTNSSFVIAYGNLDSSSGIEGNIRIGSIDQNNQINYGPISQFCNKDVYEIRVMSLQQNKFAVAFKDEDNNDRGVLVTGTINSNDQITYSDEYIFDNDNLGQLSSEMIASIEVIIGYTKFNVTNGMMSYAIRAEIGANSISFSDPVVFNDTTVSDGITPFTKLNDHQFIVQYFNSDTFEGFLRFGETDLVLGSSVNEFNHNYYITNDRTNKVLTIESTLSDLSFNVEMYDLNGRLVYLKEDNRSRIVSIDLGPFQSGMYIIRLDDGKFNFEEKILIE